MANLLRALTIFLLLCASLTGTLNAQSPGEYQALTKLPTERLLEMGHSYSRIQNMPDSALTVYTILASRYSPKMTEHEKRQMVDVFNGLWYVHFFYYSDFTLGNKAILQSLELCDETGLYLAITFFREIGKLLHLCGGRADIVEKMGHSEIIGHCDGHEIVIAHGRCFGECFFIVAHRFLVEGSAAADFRHSLIHASKIEIHSALWQA